MPEKAAQIIIIGAGISGLIAAKTLEENGYSPLVLEASETVGGRVKTSSINGYKLDHGFQVLLTAYPMAQKHLDYDALNLRYFRPGALLFGNRKKQLLGDPLRDGGALFPTITSSAATLLDKWKIFRLSSTLKNKSLDAIFSEAETTTMQYLGDYGFSNKVIQNFFQPFFTGIFLEDELKTSSRMFEFVFKMFAQGSAAIPKTGIGAIPEYLKSNLKKTRFRFNAKVGQVDKGTVKLTDGEVLNADAVISTIPLNEIGQPNAGLPWKSCENLYFELDEGALPENLIGLLTANDALANNINIHQVSGQSDLLSVTVVKGHKLSDKELENKIRTELSEQCKVQLGKFVHKFSIKMALPDIQNLSQLPRNIQQGEQPFLAGDYLANSSLNAAMASGEAAANTVIQKFAL